MSDYDAADVHIPTVDLSGASDAMLYMFSDDTGPTGDSPVSVGCCEQDPQMLFFSCPACGDPQMVDTNEYHAQGIRCDCCGVPIGFRAVVAPTEHPAVYATGPTTVSWTSAGIITVTPTEPT